MLAAPLLTPSRSPLAPPEEAPARPAYPEQDTTPTSSRELFGWYCYAWASEPFIVSAVGTFVPLLLEQFARLGGHRLGDPSTPCIPLPNAPLPGPPPGPPPAMPPSVLAAAQCVMPIVGRFAIDTLSFALYTFSILIFFQTLLVILVLGVADRLHYRKTILVLFAVAGGLISTGFLFTPYRHYLVAAALAILANCCFGVVNVCGNAFLAVLVLNHPAAQDADTRAVLQLSSSISGTGAASGYAAALVAQVCAIAIVLHVSHLTPNPNLTAPIQAAIAFVGVWWLVFQVPVVALMRSRPGPPVHLVEDTPGLLWLGHARVVCSRAVAYTRIGWHTLGTTATHVGQLQQIARFLLAWFFISDSLTTINSSAILFAKANLKMTTAQLLVISLIVVVCAVGGLLAVPRILQTPAWGIDSKRALCLVVASACAIPLYGLLGFVSTHVGLHHAWEMYVLATWYGVVLGAVATLTRSIYLTLIPTGLESTFFSLFAVTDKGSSIVGPIIVGLITDTTHELRYCFVWLLAGLLIGLACLHYGVDVDQGAKDAARFLHEIEE